MVLIRKLAYVWFYWSFGIKRDFEENKNVTALQFGPDWMLIPFIGAAFYMKEYTWFFILLLIRFIVLIPFIFALKEREKE